MGFMNDATGFRAAAFHLALLVSDVEEAVGGGSLGLMLQLAARG
jgi:hypothetical protein